MNIPAWQVITWKPVLATVDELARAVSSMQHLGTSVHIDDEGEERRYGQMLWGAEIGGRRVGIAWDWADVREGVVALADPMKILSNVVLLERDGTVLDDGARVVHLNNAIHEMTWQRQVPRRHARLARLAA
jgi:hypothetical protein